MEPSHDTPTAETAPPAAAEAELIVDNGRQRGTRRPLTFPVTLIGRNAICDLRLNADGIAPVHCVLVQGAGGLMLRDLQGKDRTRVNDQAVTICTLRNGDRLRVGPFEFQVVLPETAPAPPSGTETDKPNPPVEPEALLRLEQARLRAEAERIAVRHAALEQEEARFQQRRLALEQQREQLQGRIKQEQEKLRRDAEAQVEAEKARIRGELDSRLATEKESLRQQLDAVAAHKAQLEEEDERLKQRWLTLDQQREQTQAKLRQERDALRVQAAAVAAQQSALSEEEARLQQRRVVLQQQEEQLSAHLEEKQRRLQELQEQTREARAALQTERSTYEARVVQTTREIQIARAELADGQAQVQAQRQHLIELRRRLKRRWHRHWAAERAAMQRQTAELGQQGERLQQDREALAQARLRFNGEVELGRRQIEAGWGELRHQRHQFEQRTARERAELQQQRRELDRQEADLLALEHDLADQRAEWDTKRQVLDQEAEGLENRARNQRRKIADLQQEIARLERTHRELRPSEQSLAQTIAATAATAPGTAPNGRPGSAPDTADDAVPQRLLELEQLAEELADQRLHLAEQWERFVQAQQEWTREHESATLDWEALGQRLAAREQVLQTNEARFAQERREATQVRQRLEGWQARLAAREASWEGERDRLRAEVEARRKLVDQRLHAISALHTRWAKRRKQELERLKTEREAGDRLCQEFAALREEWLHRGAALEQEQRSLAEKTLALEQHRQETLRQSANPETVDRRLEQLRRRWGMMFAASERSLAQERERLKAEAGRLEQLFRTLRHKVHEAAAEAADATQTQTGLERDQLRHADETVQLRNQLGVLQSHCQRYEQERTQLREEIDRLAQVLMEDAETTPPLPINQAA